MDNNPQSDHPPASDAGPAGDSPSAAVSQPQQYQSYMPIRGMKVIQPLNPDIKPENVTTQPSPTGASQASAANQTPRSSQPASIASSIYPEVTHDANADSYPSTYSDTKNTEAAPEIDKKAKLIVAAVMVFGALIIVQSSTSLIAYVQVLRLLGSSSTTSSITSILGVLIDIGDLFLGIGILMRKETARAIYVVLAVILLVFALYGTYQYFKFVIEESSSMQQDITQTQQEIKRYQNDSSLSANDKAQAIQQLQTTEKSDQQIASRERGTLFPFIEAFAVSILAIVFLTRSRVKEVFS